MTVKFEMDGPLAIATFSDGPMNLLTFQSFRGLMDAVDQAIENKARAFLTLAEGDHFCAGAHITENFVGQDANFARRMLNRSIPEMQRFENLPFPTVVAVRGMCLGGGCEMAQIHDIIFAGEGASFGQVEARIGTTTLLGGAQRLVARVGLARAKEMVFSAGIYDAKTVLDWGLINRIVPDADVEAKARAYAMKLANGPTVAYAASKHLINTAVGFGQSAADQRVIESGPATFATQDMINAVNTFASEGAESLVKGTLKFTGE
ncbi:enoyl-CoA hydratase/isomerase family protein [Pseudomonas moraviensis subsp. stanleyae]|uniref:enoyl-CoA hydratase/isomerase family protein n=1 Tax=Pseudomonas moraviensis TaxID=321662 RepID=UPI002E3686A8|nr:enoyl-CoA hydratase/isomerase family protein [Pseudomonas moraviensis]MED7666669.1 enoyl-CoA hydratase/isomerase family protein [Pseudomonas moraviensis subsp. stanleyae]